MPRMKKTPPAATRNREAAQSLNELNKRLPGYAYSPNRASDDFMYPLEEPQKPKRPLWKRILLWALTILLLLVLIWGGKLLYNQIKVFGWGGTLSVLKSTKLKGEDTGHVNILLAGNSSDDPGHGGGDLTDSIMVASIDTRNHTAFMLSVPRDLYVNIPGHGYAKINEAYQDGEQDKFSESGYASGGMGLLEKVISQNFNISLHYYALVDYQAVRDAVNAVGGIDVTITSTDPRGLYDPSPDLANNYQPLVKLPNGTDHLNGVQALGLARARGDHYGAYGYGQGDFVRTQNQRAILLALKAKATSAGVLANPVKSSELFDTFGNNVKTDLDLAGVRRLYDLTKDTSGDHVTSAGLNNIDGNNKSLLASYTNRYGQSTLVPKAGIDDYSDIQAYVQQLLNPPAASTSSTSSTSTTSGR